jgi:GTP cyclohydrolase IB
MIDLQGERSPQGMALARVGVSDLSYPIRVQAAPNVVQATIGRFEMAVRLQADERGTHMSRFVEFVHGSSAPYAADTVGTRLKQLAERLGSQRAFLDVSFPLFFPRKAPVSGAEGLLDVSCRLRGEIQEGNACVTMIVRVPVTSLCPCSKAISDYGAHNQRGYVTIETELATADTALHFAELVVLAEGAGSSPVYPLLKRPDERFVTMAAYDKPMFVEDMARHVAKALASDARVGRYRVHAENLESIHSHSAFAEAASE